MQDLRVTLVQRMLHWEDAVANRGMFAQVLLPLKGATDLIILPEMFTTGFNMRSIELAEDMNGATVQWMIDQAKKIDAAIYGSVIIKENGAFYNRGLFVKPDGGSFITTNVICSASPVRTITIQPGPSVWSWRGVVGASCYRSASTFVSRCSRAIAVITMPSSMWPTGLKHAGIRGASY
jgi:omega-amidase